MEEKIFEKMQLSYEDEITDDEVTTEAKSSFNITYLYPYQRIVIENIMESAARYGFSDYKAQDTGENNLNTKDRQIVLLPTGAGKSLCFLTPALLLKGPTLVIYPLLALMADQKRRMDEADIKSVIFKGGQSEEERNENFKKIKNGAKIILANPEVLQDKSLLFKLKKIKIAHLAIDEAHCISEWGDTFRPSYLTLGNIIKELDIKTVTAFTATASEKVLDRITEVLFNGKYHLIKSSSDRPNIHYYVVKAWCKKRQAFMLALNEEKPLIIFCGTRKKSENMARELASFYGNDKVKFYHAGMQKEEKDFVEKWFYPSKDGILCCTCAFGMGVDKKDIHTVIHLEVSPTAESYIQEAGRGGRDGSIAKAILLWNHNDSKKYEIYKKGSRERVLKEFAESKNCRRQILVKALGGEEEVFCDGCDICLNKKSEEKAEDAFYAFNFIKKNNFLYKKEELVKLLTKKLNKKDGKSIKNCLWHTEDVKEILNQLYSENLIKKGNFMLKNRIGLKSRKIKLPDF